MTVKITCSTKIGQDTYIIESEHIIDGEVAAEQLQKAKDALFPKVVTKK